MEEGQAEEHVVKESATRNRSAREGKVKATRKPYWMRRLWCTVTIQRMLSLYKPFLEYVLEVTN